MERDYEFSIEKVKCQSARFLSVYLVIMNAGIEEQFQEWLMNENPSLGKEFKEYIIIL